ncbi:MAG: two-component regulator propeller domain-containing protein [Chloroflexota bacterium]
MLDQSGRLIRALQGPYGLVNMAAFSPAGDQIVTANQIPGAIVWDTQGNTLFELNGHQDSLNWAGFSPDGQRLLTDSQDGSLRLWDLAGDTLAEMKIIRTEATRDQDTTAFSPDGRYILALSQGKPYLWSLDGRLQYTLQDPTGGLGISYAVFSPDGESILAVGDNGSLLEWQDWGSPPQQLPLQVAPETTLTFSPDGSWLLLTNPKQIQVLYSRDWTSQFTFASTQSIKTPTSPSVAASFNPDSRTLAIVDGSSQVQLWQVGSGAGPEALQSGLSQVGAVDFSPDGQSLLLGGCLYQDRYERLELGAPVTALALGWDDDIWVTTEGDGVYRLNHRFEVENTTWQHYTTQDSGLASDQVLAITAGPGGTLWFGTARGLSTWDGVDWERPHLPDVAETAPVTAFLEDSQGGMWAGAGGRVAHWDGQKWTSFEVLSGSPELGGVMALFEDSRGGIWAGTVAGALRYDGQRWSRLVTTPVSVFAEQPAGVVWAGGLQGLVRYNLDTGDQALYTTTSPEVALPANAVQDLQVDSQGNLWVSTFESQVSGGSPAWALAITALFFSGVFLYTYRGYQRSPQVRARRLRRRLQSRPEAALGELYLALRGQPDAGQVLAELALPSPGQPPTWKPLAAGLEKVSLNVPEPDLDAWEDFSGQLQSAEGTIGAPELGCLYEFLVQAGRAASIHQIVAWSVRLARRTDLARPMLVSETCQPLLLPELVDGAALEALDALGQASTFLGKYMQVEHSGDKVSYLADTLGAVERAARQAAAAQLPERSLLVPVADRWRELVNGELNAFSGQADLRLELRTRQLRRAPRLTVALQLKNAGRAVAENICVTLLEGEGFISGADTQKTLPRLSVGDMAALDFDVQPGEASSLRIACRVTWNDRAGAGRQTDFADMVTLYRQAEEFRPIDNPYVPGPPVKDARLFTGRQDVFQFIQDSLHGRSQQRSLVLHGQRRTGKTSILYQLLGGRLGDKFIPALVDMQELAPLVLSEADFFAELADKLQRAAGKAGLELTAPGLEAFNVSPARAFKRFLDDLEPALAGRQVLVMFDEFELIEELIEKGRLSEDVLGYVRSLIQHRESLVFIFTGTHRLEEMSRDYWSIFFNITLYRKISFLSQAEAERLIRAPVEGLLQVDDLAVEKIIALTRSHPYFLQLLCWALVNHTNAQRRNYATLNDVNEVLEEILMTGEPYFAYIWQQARHGERLALAGLAHAMQAGQSWARPEEILASLVSGGDVQTQRDVLLADLDRLVQREVLEIASEGALRYRFQIELLRHWVAMNKTISILVGRGA